jgi:hypothetical protein
MDGDESDDPPPSIRFTTIPHQRPPHVFAPPSEQNMQKNSSTQQKVVSVSNWWCEVVNTVKSL